MAKTNKEEFDQMKLTQNQRMSKLRSETEQAYKNSQWSQPSPLRDQRDKEIEKLKERLVRQETQIDYALVSLEVMLHNLRNKIVDKYPWDIRDISGTHKQLKIKIKDMDNSLCKTLQDLEWDITESKNS